jgi:hypothetical protein
MELLLSKSQKTGIMGGITFSLSVKSRLTDEEAMLVKKYKLGKEIVYERLPDMSGMGDFRATFTILSAKALKLIFTVDNLVVGRLVECKDILEVMAAEGEIRQAADNFYTLLMACKDFGGEEVITYPRPD